MRHELKVWPEYFEKIQNGEKPFEVRKDDREFKVGDDLFLREFDNEKQEYTGRYTYRDITYILKGGQFGIEEGFVVMTIR